eukprot:6470806-Pyramimonas_sp.AAC.1
MPRVRQHIYETSENSLNRSYSNTLQEILIFCGPHPHVPSTAEPRPHNNGIYPRLTYSLHRCWPVWYI